MKYSKPRCPECGELLTGECDIVPGIAEVEQLKDGSFEYTGNTDMFWDGQRNEHEEKQYYEGLSKGGTIEYDDLILVQCEAAHQWLTAKDFS